MPKLTPQDLSRKKEYADLVLRRQAEEVRSRHLREQQARLQGGAGVTVQFGSLFCSFLNGCRRVLALIVLLSNSPMGLDRTCRQSEVK